MMASLKYPLSNTLILIFAYSTYSTVYDIKCIRLTKFLGSKNKCSFHEHMPVDPMSSLAVENFFSFRTMTSTNGSVVLFS